MNRREFLITPLAWPLVASAVPATAQVSTAPREQQTFRVGYAPELGEHPTDAKYWEAFDACSRLGFHYVETNNNATKIADSYGDRTPEFKEKMAERKLTMVGLAMGSNMVDAGKRRQVMDQTLKVGRFLQAVGGRYITLLFAFPADPHLSPLEWLQRMTKDDFRNFAETANEVGKALGNETGIHYGYHPERHEVMAQMVGRIMEMTDPRYLGFVPDTGHIRAGGADPLDMCKKYRSRMIAMHLKDWDPKLPWGDHTPGDMGRMVALGKGVVHFSPLIAFLKESRFTGYVMVELRGQAEPTQEEKDYLEKNLNLRLA